jgi:hypothetical protein
MAFLGSISNAVTQPIGIVTKPITNLGGSVLNTVVAKPANKIDQKTDKVISTPTDIVNKTGDTITDTAKQAGGAVKDINKTLTDLINNPLVWIGAGAVLLIVLMKK